jgi:hypothetical protein
MFHCVLERLLKHPKKAQRNIGWQIRRNVVILEVDLRALLRGNFSAVTARGCC